MYCSTDTSSFSFTWSQIESLPNWPNATVQDTRTNWIGVNYFFRSLFKRILAKYLTICLNWNFFIESWFEWFLNFFNVSNSNTGNAPDTQWRVTDIISFYNRYFFQILIWGKTCINELKSIKKEHQWKLSLIFSRGRFKSWLWRSHNCKGNRGKFPMCNIKVQIKK